MAITTAQVKLWKRNAVMISDWAPPVIKVLQERIIALSDEVLANREARPEPTGFIACDDALPGEK